VVVMRVVVVVVGDSVVVTNSGRSSPIYIISLLFKILVCFIYLDIFIDIYYFFKFLNIFTSILLTIPDTSPVSIGKTLTHKHVLLTTNHPIGVASN